MPPVRPEDREEARSWLDFTLRRLSPSVQRKLLARFGAPDSVLAQPLSTVRAEFGAEVAQALAAAPPSEAIETALAWLDDVRHHLLTLADAAYPRNLLALADAPLVLYVVGDPGTLIRPAVAIVGARRATPGGLENARAFARALAERGFVVVSGLALGVDAAAHEGALEAEDGRTVAIVGTGADRVYPAKHRGLAHRIAERGAIVSEFPLGTAAQPYHFPRRNRLIAALARGTLVVEAAPESGSLITARLAAELGRDVFAIPGSIHNPLARGCHRLIREGAKLVERVDDLLEEWPDLVPTGAVARPSPTTPPPVAADDPLLTALGHDPVDFDTLMQRTGLTSEALSAMLLPLELDGAVVRLPGGRYQRTR
ncbi:DNA-processing protein DprA [Tepidiphilus baoligensis]|uniref:DNA-protecting protein DprA n=1 Tax=Tepidiphilus baoligensis TaxID=2698687 RepID=A0ABX1QMP5_9PROT|nr:DNA-processing protein DprA [Tepidiphilus baoligensis]NMH16494.1 DNA-protecting protein DprA [Tepidiphilus baoligensis]